MFKCVYVSAATSVEIYKVVYVIYSTFKA